MRRCVWLLMMLVWCVGIGRFAVAGLAGEVAAWFVVASMLQALTLAAANELGAGDSDDGVLIPLLYLVGGLVAPVGWPTMAGQVLVVAIMGGTIVCRLWLGVAFTVGGSRWVGLRDRGPYALVRHPLILLDVVGRFGIACCYWVPGNVLVAWAYAGCMVAVVLLEERFLLRREEYAAYAARVPWRLVPGLW